MQKTESRYLNISFHDLTPHSWEKCRTFLEELKALGCRQTNLLVVPNWYGQFPLSKHPAFVEWLNEQETLGHEICLHGCTHRAYKRSNNLFNYLIGHHYTAGEGEFYLLNAGETREALHKGLTMLQEAQLSVQGFIAPAWLLSRDAYAVIKEMGFLYTTSLMHFYLLNPARRYYAPAITWSSRSGWRRGGSRLWGPLWARCNRRTNVLRIAVHPNDLHYAQLKANLMKTIQNALYERTPLTYAELAQRLFSTPDASYEQPK